MSQAVLLTLGRLPKGLELARCLSAAGCKVYVADPFSAHLSKPSRHVTKSIKVAAPNDDQAQFLADMLAIVKRYAIDVIYPVSEEVMHIAQLEDSLPQHTKLFCPPKADLLQLHDKFAFIEAAKAAGLDIPETYRGDDPAGLALIQRADYVVKPALGCSGNGLILAREGDLLADEARVARNVIQRRINGPEISTYSIARDGKVLGTVLYRGLIFAGTVATSFERIPAMPAIEAWIERFVEAQGYSGSIAFDFIVDETGTPYPIECNPRLTSGVHFMHHGDLADALLGAPLTGPIRFKANARLQEGHTSLTKAYGALPKVGIFLKRLALVLRTRDVLWSWRDPLPFLLMTPMSWPVLAQVFFHGASFGEAATRDIEWHASED